MKKRDVQNMVSGTFKFFIACVACFAWFAEGEASTLVSITRAQWEAAGATTVAEALARVGRIHVTNAGGPGQRSVAWINGYHPAEVMVALNGISISDVSRRAQDLAQYDLEGLSVIDVTDGPSIDIPGQGARRIGINLVTRKEEALTGSVRAGLGSSATLGGGGQIFFPFGLGVAAGYGQSDGSRPSMRWVARHGMASWQQDVSEAFSVTAAAMGYSDGVNFGTPGFGEIDGVRERVALMAMGRWAASESSHLKFGVSALYTQRRYVSTSGVTASGPLRQGGVHWAYATRVNEADTVTVQGSYSDALAEDGLFQSTRWSWGDFLIQNKLDFNNIVLFLAELRADQHSMFGPYLNPTLEFVVNLASSRVVLSVANTVTFPSMDEVGMSPIVLSGTTWMGNASLQPERSWVYRLSAEQQMNGCTVGVDFSGGGGESLIDHNWLLSGGVRMPTNVPTARMVGVGVNLNAPLAEGLEYWAGYQFREWRSGSTVLTDRPRQTIIQSLRWTSAFGWGVSGWASYAQLPMAGVTPFPFVESDGAAAHSVNYGFTAGWKSSDFFRMNITVDNVGGTGRFGLEGYAVAPNHVTGTCSFAW